MYMIYNYNRAKKSPFLELQQQNGIILYSDTKPRAGKLDTATATVAVPRRTGLVQQLQEGGSKPKHMITAARGSVDRLNEPERT